MAGQWALGSGQNKKPKAKEASSKPLWFLEVLVELDSVVCTG